MTRKLRSACMAEVRISGAFFGASLTLVTQ
jgi:hypothetical protein